MTFKIYPTDLTKEQVIEQEDLVYEEQVKASSNANFCFGIAAAWLILFTIIRTIIAMRSNYDLTTWVMSIIDGKLLAISLVLIFFQQFFVKYNRKLRLQALCLTNYDDYVKQGDYIKKAYKIYQYENLGSYAFMGAIALCTIALFLSAPLELYVRFACLGMFILFIIIACISESYKKRIWSYE